ncbi:MAG: putative single-stranded DNA-binding protein [Prokaryotic dsDNA virus sp.]|nr:MAG: putative single-stranded DNA-binding protein [Prokaryotic dsDNA virus sp.]|tara:strand:+ start:1429 stop:1842 length:414 start_codon:yes stop_codon:yes gene_type:complete
MNKCTLSGRLTKDPELKFVGKAERAVVNASIAVERQGRGAKKTDGSKNRETDFWDLTFWGQTAETVGRYVKKGDQIFVTGDVIIEKWEKDGVKRSRPILEVSTFDFGAKSRANSGEKPSSSGGATDIFGRPEEEVPF